MPHPTSRRAFMTAAGTAAVGASLFPDRLWAAPPARRRYAIVGTGDRGSGMWGRDLVRRYPDLLEFVGLCDINPKRATAARAYMGVECGTYTNVDEMLDAARPDLLMVTTVDGFHHEYIIKGLDRGIDVMTEKPMTTDETKCQAVLDAEKRNNRRIAVTFNYRYAPAKSAESSPSISAGTSTSFMAPTTSAAGIVCAATAVPCWSIRRRTTSTS
jgi:NAD-dependent oxidoreductase involved in siderophore biosynthesis